MIKLAANSFIFISLHDFNIPSFQVTSFLLFLKHCSIWLLLLKLKFCFYLLFSTVTLDDVSRNIRNVK